MAAANPITIMITLRLRGARDSSPRLGAGGGWTRASTLPTTMAPPRASSRYGSRLSPRNTDAGYRHPLVADIRPLSVRFPLNPPLCVDETAGVVPPRAPLTGPRVGVETLHKQPKPALPQGAGGPFLGSHPP